VASAIKKRNRSRIPKAALKNQIASFSNSAAHFTMPSPRNRNSS